MINLDTFYAACTAAIGRDPNDEQKSALRVSAQDPLFIVAGPGTGKTACLTLRILKLVLVDRIPPQGILATTFTKKAAAELRSRILSWGFKLIEHLKDDTTLPEPTRAWCAQLDINQTLTGTIDSICEQLLRDHRDPGTLPPVLADEFVAKTLLLREGFFGAGRFNDSYLDGFLKSLHGGGYGFGLGKKNDLAQNFWDRRFHDQVDWQAFASQGANADEVAAKQVLTEVHDAYKASLDQRNLVDFSLLENEVLVRLSAGGIKEFRDQLRVVLVDEYQDTNLLQEKIYFELAKSCGGALTVVGDDDQSLYRFRGATVELYRDFADRYNLVFGTKPSPIFLKTNYRSTQNILNFVNSYAGLDKGYQSARVTGKPILSWKPGAEQGFPVLGLFREDLDTLAEDLSQIIHQTFRGSGFVLPDGNIIAAAAKGGNVGDCALLCSSPAEYKPDGKGGWKARLPGFLREKLREMSPAIEVFNPRGQDLTDIEIVSIFGGFLLECLDPGGVVEDTIKWLGQSERDIFRTWRDKAVDYLSSGKAPAGLDAYAIGWAERDPRRKGYVWPKSVPVLELVYGLLHFFPQLHDDPEGQIYLEVFTRQVTACEEVGKFSARVVHDPSNAGLSDASVKELIVDFLAPITSGTISVNEDLMEAFPRDRLNVLSIHQSKGLEFPMTIVDIGSEFGGNYSSQAFKRFPADGGPPQRLENLLRPYTALGAPSRSARDRSFDDLYRQYFVAYSRSQEILLLVGLRKTIPEFKVMNVAAGWTRDGSSRWQSALPLTLI